MIIISTMFFCEKEILDMRLEEELPHVDEFHIIEAGEVFSRPVEKPLMLKQEDMLPKVTLHHISIPVTSGSWEREAFARNYILSAKTLADDDVLILCDMDEVMRGDQIPDIVAKARANGWIGINMTHHYYYINNVTQNRSAICKSFAATGKFIKDCGGDLDKIRNRNDKPEMFSGHHFDYLQTPEEISWKLTCFAHTEYSVEPYTNLDHIRARINAGEDLFNRLDGRVWIPGVLDETYPQVILDNPEKWEKWMSTW